MSEAIKKLIDKRRALSYRIEVLDSQIKSASRQVDVSAHGRYLSGHFIGGVGCKGDYMANDTVTSIINDAYQRSVDILQAELDIVVGKIEAIETLLEDI